MCHPLCGLVTLLATFALALHAQEQPKLAPAKPQAVRDAKAAIMRKMEAIRLPELKLDKATLKQAVELLIARSRELDKADVPDGRKGVDIRLHPEVEPEKASVSLELKNVPLSEALRYVSELAQTNIKVETDSVLLVPLWIDTSEKFTRTFRVPPDFLLLNQRNPNIPVPPDPFVAPEDETKRDRNWQSARQILEAQGITFPAGASATFNPTTGLLTVTNSQPNLDLLEAYFSSSLLYPQTITHQLIIIEGPGELIRMANAAASRTADARKELDMLLDHAKNPGSNVRVAADAFLETKSGTHSSTTAVREHVSSPHLDFDKKSRPSIAWELRPLGLTLEVEPTIHGDSLTIDNRLDIKFHPVSPRMRQMRVTEPLTAREAEFPFSVTAGADFKTTLVSTAGATKLIGVTKPVGLADQKADVLCAAFLTSSIRRVEALPQSPPLPETSPAPDGMIAAIFHVAPGLLESLMESTSQPLGEWLEKEQGISFPAGAVMEQKGEHLHITHTPAMIEAIGALIAHAETIAPKTVAFTLHTMEAPAALVRDLARQSTVAGSDDTAMFTTVTAATARGEARFINSTFLETQPGTRASHESVREHAFISEFAITDKNQPEVIFEMRKVGSIIEVEPAISADGHTVELNFSHELHPAPPETRGAYFRDPASGQRFAMPATDFHVMKTTTGLSMTKGSIKLISLNQPTGREAEGKLWATFLKCDVVPQVAKLKKRAAPAVNIPDGGGLETRSYKLPPDFMSRNPADEDETETDPFETPRRRQRTKPNILEANGITFPEGSSASFNPATSTLAVRNTLKNLALVERFVNEINSTLPKTAVLTTHVLQAPGPLLRRLTTQAASKSNHRAELDELLAAVKKGEAQTLGTNRIETKPGNRASTQQGRKHAALSEVSINKEGVPEIITVERNVGFKVELEPTVGDDGQLVELQIAPEFHTAAPIEHRERILDTQGRRLEFPLTDYHVAKLTTATTIPEGTVRLLSLYKPTGKPEFEKEDILQAIFITCDILRAGE